METCLTLVGKVMCCRAQTAEQVWRKRRSTSPRPPVWSGGPCRKTTAAGFLCRCEALVNTGLLEGSVGGNILSLKVILKSPACSFFSRSPLPQDFEQWLRTGLQTYTGACRERGNTPGLRGGCSCSAETVLRKTIRIILERYWQLGDFQRLPPPWIPIQWDRRPRRRGQNPAV